MKTIVHPLKAVADQTRLTMLKLLQTRELCVCELTAALELAQSTVSKHLKILEDAGLLASRKEGLYVFYRLSTDTSNEFALFLLSGIRERLEDDPQVIALREQLLGFDQEALCSAQKRKEEGR
jgi:ArsR family transcriptional regulator